MTFKDIVKKSVLFGLGAIFITKEEIEKFATDLQKDGKLTPSEGKKLVKEVFGEVDKSIKNLRLKEKIDEILKDKGLATKKDIEDLKQEIKKVSTAKVKAGSKPSSTKKNK